MSIDFIYRVPLESVSFESFYFRVRLQASVGKTLDAGGAGAAPVKDREPPPRMEQPTNPVNGVVQPPVHPPPDRKGRITNQLEFLKTTVLSAVVKHHFSWPFKQPVDAKKLNLPVSSSVKKFKLQANTSICW